MNNIFVFKVAIIFWSVMWQNIDVINNSLGHKLKQKFAHVGRIKKAQIQIGGTLKQ